MKRIILSVIIFLVATTSYSQTGTKTYTLNEALATAVRNNYDIKLSYSQIKTANSGLTSAFGDYLPSMNFNMGYNRQLNPEGVRSANIGGLIIDIPGSDPNSYSMNAVASINVFDGFSREANYRRANSTYEASKLSNEYTINSIKIEVYRNFLNLVRNRQIVRIRRENLNLGLKELERIQAQFNAGVISQSVVYAQEAELGNREIELIRAENELNIAQSLLLTIMGLNPDMSVEFLDTDIPNQITDDEIINFRREIGSINAAISYALEHRIDYNAQNQQIVAARSSVDIARSAYFPRVSANAGWTWNNSEFNAFDRGRSFVGLSLNVPIFENFNTNFQIQNSQLNLEQRRTELLKLEQIIRSNIQTGFWNLEASEKQVDVARRALRSSRLNYESTDERFKVGAVNITELIQANTQLITSQINQITAVYGYIQAQKEILFAIGKLN